MEKLDHGPLPKPDTLKKMNCTILTFAKKGNYGEAITNSTKLKLIYLNDLGRVPNKEEVLWVGRADLGEDKNQLIGAFKKDSFSDQKKNKIRVDGLFTHKNGNIINKPPEGKKVSGLNWGIIPNGSKKSEIYYKKSSNFNSEDFVYYHKYLKLLTDNTTIPVGFWVLSEDEHEH